MIYLIAQFLMLAAVVLLVDKPSFVSCMLVGVLSLLLGSLFYKTIFNGKKIKYFSLFILSFIAPVVIALMTGVKHFEIYLILAGLCFFGCGLQFASFLQHSEDIDLVMEEHDTLAKENVNMSQRISELVLDQSALMENIDAQIKQSENIRLAKNDLEAQLSQLVSQKNNNELASQNKQKRIDQIEKQLQEKSDEVKIRDSNIVNLKDKLNQAESKYTELVNQCM